MFPILTLPFYHLQQRRLCKRTLIDTVAEKRVKEGDGIHHQQSLSIQMSEYDYKSLHHTLRKIDPIMSRCELLFSRARG